MTETSNDFIEPKIMTLHDLAPILRHTITSKKGYKIEPRHCMQPADQHLNGDPLKFSDIFERTMAYLEKVGDWTPASILYGKLSTAGYSPDAIKATFERLKNTTNIGTKREDGESVFRWYERNEPFDTLNQQALDEWKD